MRMTTLPPGPSNSLWAMTRFVREPYTYLAAMRDKYGDPFTLPTLFGPVVTTAEPDNIRAILGADPDTFDVPSRAMSVPLLGEGSLLTNSGEPHRRQRKLLTPPFHGARLRAYGQLMREAARAHVARLPEAGAFDLQASLHDISLEVIFAAHRRAERYPEPAAFRPERFLGQSYSPFEFLPFGGGARRCIGAAFALYEMKLVLATIVRATRLRLARKGPTRPSVRGIVVSPKDGLPMMRVA